MRCQILSQIFSSPRFRVFAVAFFISSLWATNAGAGAASADEGAKQFLDAIYAPYVSKNGRGTDYGGKEDRFFTPELAALLVKDSEEAGEEIGRIDADIFIDAQDWVNLTAKIQLRSDGKTVDSAYVTLSNTGMTKRIYYALKQLPSGWRIADIRWEGRRDSLIDILKKPDDAKDASEVGPKEFLEDIYRHYTSQKDVPFNYLTGKDADLYFTRDVIDLVEADSRAHVGEPGSLEFDLFAGGQEYDKIKADIQIQQSTDNTALAVASLNDSIVGPSTITYNLVKTSKGWRISEMRWSSEKKSLIEMLKDSE